MNWSFGHGDTASPAGHSAVRNNETFDTGPHLQLILVLGLLAVRKRHHLYLLHILLVIGVLQKVGRRLRQLRARAAAWRRFSGASRPWRALCTAATCMYMCECSAPVDKPKIPSFAPVASAASRRRVVG